MRENASKNFRIVKLGLVPYNHIFRYKRGWYRKGALENRYSNEQAHRLEALVFYKITSSNRNDKVAVYINKSKINN